MGKKKKTIKSPTLIQLVAPIEFCDSQELSHLKTGKLGWGLKAMNWRKQLFTIIIS